MTRMLISILLQYLTSQFYLPEGHTSKPASDQIHDADTHSDLGCSSMLFRKEVIDKSSHGNNRVQCSERDLSETGVHETIAKFFRSGTDDSVWVVSGRNGTLITEILVSDIHSDQRKDDANDDQNQCTRNSGAVANHDKDKRKQHPSVVVGPVFHGNCPFKRRNQACGLFEQGNRSAKLNAYGKRSILAGSRVFFFSFAL